MELKFPLRLFASAAAAFALTLPILSACSREPSEVPVIRVVCAPNDHHAALYAAALSPDYFRENGNLYLQEKTFRKEYDLIEDGRIAARIEIDAGDEGSAARKLRDTMADFAFGSFPEMAIEVDSGSRVKVLAPLTAGGTGLVVRGEMCASDLKGFVAQARANARPLSIGYAQEGAGQKISFEGALMREGLPAGNGVRNPRVTTVNLYDKKNLIPALKAGVVDGFLGRQPLLAEAVSSASGKLIYYLDDYEKYGGGGYFPFCCIAAREGFIEKNKGASEKFLTLVLRANRYVYQNPRGAAPQVARWLDRPVELEEISLPTIKYGTGRVDEWKEGAEAWLVSAASRNEITGDVRRAWEDGDALERIFDLSMLGEASKKM